MRVEVYVNLHKQCLSVRALEGPHKGRVINRTDSITLKDVKYVVQPAGHSRRTEERPCVRARHGRKPRLESGVRVQYVRLQSIYEFNIRG